jgi:hypothetical protein
VPNHNDGLSHFIRGSENEAGRPGMACLLAGLGALGTKSGWSCLGLVGGVTAFQSAKHPEQPLK